MKIRYALLCWCLSLGLGRCLSQQPDVTRHFGVGISASHLGVDGAFGIDVCTPLAIHDHFGFRIRGNEAWMENYKATVGHWATYQTLTTGVLYVKKVADRTRLVGEAGPVVIFSSKRISPTRVTAGYFASFGIEYFFRHSGTIPAAYQMSFGYMDSSSRAGKLENPAKYATGFVVNVGFRLYF